MLAGETQALMNSIWEAQLYSPDEILHVSNVMSNVTTKNKKFAFAGSAIDYLIGQRSGEITFGLLVLVL